MKTKMEDYAKAMLESLKDSRDVLKKHIKDTNADLLSKGLAEMQYEVIEDFVLTTVINILMITRDLEENEEGEKVVEEFIGEILEKNEERTDE